MRQPASLEPLALQLGFHGRARGLGQCRVAIQENQTGGEFLGQLDAGFGRHGSQEPFRFLQQQTAAVAGFPVAGDRPTVGEAV